MNLVFRYAFFNELGLDGRRDVFLIMGRTDAGGNDGDQVGRVHPQALLHGLDGVGHDVAGGARLAGMNQGAVAVFLVVQPDGGAVRHVNGKHAVGNPGADQAVRAFHGVIGADVPHQGRLGAVHLFGAAQILPPPAQGFHFRPVVRFQPFQHGFAVSGYVHSRNSFNELDDFPRVGLDGLQECRRFHN